jgi:prolyl 4-hydroxylase
MSQSPQFLSIAQGLREGRADAPEQMKALARQGDPDAMMMVGEFHLIGLHGPRNFERGFKLIARAADKGQEHARRAVVYLTSRGLGRKANPKLARTMLARLAQEDRFAAVQNGLLEHLECRKKVRTLAPRMISEDPYVAIWQGLFNRAEYEYLRRIGAPTLRPAMIANPQTGQGLLDPIRKSDTTAIPIIEEDLIVREIVTTIAEATGTGVDQGEALTLLRYAPGQEYKLHYDAYDAGWNAPQRVYTALIWLNDEYEGGETHFPELGLTVRGMAGDMLVFSNLTPEGTLDKRMKHAGLPVKAGEKWLASRWISTTSQLDLPNSG